MKKFNIPAARVVRHYDISGKICPGIEGWNNATLYDNEGKALKVKNNSKKWEEFKKKLI
jgi:N-acetylmuramoyl-L-alanine amidase CwlA